MTDRPINLLPAVYGERRRVRARARAWSSIVAAWAGVMLVTATGFLGRAAGEQRAIDGSPAWSPHRADDLERRTREARAECERMERELAAARAVTGHPDWSVLLGLLARLRGDRIALSRVDIHARTVGPNDASSYTVTIGGVGETQPDAVRFAGALEEIGLFDSVQLKETRPTQIGEQEHAAFELVCSMSASIRPARSAGAEGKP